MNLKLFKRTAACATLAAMMLGLVACGGSGDATKEKDPGSKTKKEATEKKSPYADLKVGVLLIGSHTDTSGYSFAHAQGVKDAIKNLGMNEDQIIWKDLIPDTMDNSSDALVTTAIEECIKDGAKVIFTTSWGYKNATKALAEKYPDIYFAHGTGDLCNGTNFINYFGRIYQARYLSGIAAGLKTTSNKIGYVSAWGLENSECTGGINAFAMGVASVNPNAKVYVRTTNSWFDQAKEKSEAEWLLTAGCDVMAQHVDTAEPQIAAEKVGAFGIGWNSDMAKEAPNAILTSVLWHWDAFYTWAIQAVGDGTWDGKNYLGGLNEGMVSLSPLTALNNPEAQAKIDEATNKMKSGTWDVFSGVIETNAGTTVGTAGTSLDDNTILFGINWYYKNIVLTNPAPAAAQ